MRKSFYILICVISWYNATAYGQSNAACTDILRAAYDEFRTPTGEGYALSYIMKTTVVDGSVTAENIALKFYNGKSLVKTNSTTIYQDSETMVAIDHERKSIFITRAMDQNVLQQQFGQSTLLQDSLLDNSHHISCNNTANNKNEWQITLSDQNKMITDLGLSSMTYWIDRKVSRINKISAVYLPDNSMMKSVEVSFGQVDKSYQEEVFAGAALKLVYTEEEHVRLAFSQYKIINNLKQ